MAQISTTPLDVARTRIMNAPGSGSQKTLPLEMPNPPLEDGDMNPIVRDAVETNSFIVIRDILQKEG